MRPLAPSARRSWHLYRLALVRAPSRRIGRELVLVPGELLQTAPNRHEQTTTLALGPIRIHHLLPDCLCWAGRGSACWAIRGRRGLRGRHPWRRRSMGCWWCWFRRGDPCRASDAGSLLHRTAVAVSSRWVIWIVVITGVRLCNVDTAWRWIVHETGFHLMSGVMIVDSLTVTGGKGSWGSP